MQSASLVSRVRLTTPPSQRRVETTITKPIQLTVTRAFTLISSAYSWIKSIRLCSPSNIVSRLATRGLCTLLTTRGVPLAIMDLHVALPFLDLFRNTPDTPQNCADGSIGTAVLVCICHSMSKTISLPVPFPLTHQGVSLYH